MSWDLAYSQEENLIKVVIHEQTRVDNKYGSVYCDIIFDYFYITWEYKNINTMDMIIIDFFIKK